VRPDEPSPLSEPVLHILLALAEEPRHGYGIILRVEEWTGGRLVLRTGTLYTALRRMAVSGWIEETEVDEPESRRRNYYRLTASGRELLRSETSRVRELAELAGRVLG
jgi:DNA-binding PadR family transcriptional regulator